MKTMGDYELLRRYAETRCEAAFAELVRRYVDLVYSAALRQVGGNAHAAQDVTQSVFIDLARKAASLSGRTVLAGWLYTSTHYAAAKVVRAEQRWQTREQKAMAMREISEETGPAPDWAEVGKVLDKVMLELNPADRNAVLLRFFEQRQLGEVGTRLGISEDGARKRVERALDKLRALLKKRGIASSSAALVTLLASQSVVAAPAGLAVNIAGVAVAGAVASTGMTLTFLEFMTLSKLKLGLLGALVVAGMVTPLVIQHQTQAKLRAENQALRQQNEQIAGLAAENSRLASLEARAIAAPAVRRNDSNEVLRLRSEVTRLRSDAEESARLKALNATGPGSPSVQITAQMLASRATQLRQRLEQKPELKIPELNLLKDKDWLDAAGSVESLQSEEDFSLALSNLRGTAKDATGQLMRDALKKYAQANNDSLPAELSQLQAYFNPPVDTALLQRYELKQTGKLGEVDADQALFVETAHRLDDEYDSHYQFSLNGTTSRTTSKTGSVLEAAATAYANAHDGRLPQTPEHLASYLQQPVDPARVQKFLGKIPPNVTTLEQLKAGKER